MLWKERQSESPGHKKQFLPTQKPSTRSWSSSSWTSSWAWARETSDEWRMTNSPWAVGTNGKFTESATFHNSARRQLSTKQRSSWPKGPEQRRNSLGPFLSGATRRNSHGPPSATIFTLPNTFPASAECEPHPVNTNNTNNNNNSPKTKRQRQSKDKEEERDYKILMCLSIRHKLYNYHLCIYILLDRPLI